MNLPRAFYGAPFAHRGLHDISDGRPENSRAAIRAAIAMGYGIEIDVQLSADDAAMVFHDYGLERLTAESGSIRANKSATLAQMKLRGGDEGIPTLEEVFDLVGGRVPLLVEVKDQDGGMGADIGALEVAVVTALEGYAGPLALMSFNPNSVVRMAELAPNVPRGIVTSAYDPADWSLPEDTCAHLRAIRDYDRAGACFISHEATDLARPRVAELKAEGSMICCWTVRSAAEETVARMVADNITFEGYHPALIT